MGKRGPKPKVSGAGVKSIWVTDEELVLVKKYIDSLRDGTAEVHEELWQTFVDYYNSNKKFHDLCEKHDLDFKSVLSALVN